MFCLSHLCSGGSRQPEVPVAGALETQQYQQEKPPGLDFGSATAPPSSTPVPCSLFNLSHSPQAQDWPRSARGSRFRTGQVPHRRKRKREKERGSWLSTCPAEPGMWGYLSLLPAFLAVWAITGVWTVFALAVANRAVNLTEGFPYIRAASSASCSTWELLWESGSGAPAHFPLLPAAWICIIRYHQLRDLGVGKWFNLLILWTGLLCALGTSVVGNFQQKNQLPTHLTGAFFAFFVGNLYFWMQHLLFWWMKSLPQPGPPWIGPLRLGLCSLCTILMVTMVILHSWLLRSASAACEWAVAMLLFTLFGLFAVDFSGLDGCTLTLRPGPSLSSPPASPISLQIPL
ncbi:modulator of macroautophagy TMEM150B isoform X10 [Leopardus geoffroyi]|uniref:modulator of macroautophagy TMEM150B isoform X10 n=1 Tax=Leopardus geoffroyi TaxID=46844 RepID=UPI001E26189D|nr:modulator of macroautophagy TMEM150B isoform X10 [Leopardus geoffroyi]